MFTYISFVLEMYITSNNLVGESVKYKNGYYTNKISVEYEIPGSGVGWELNTSSSNEYTICFEMDKEASNTI